uniref:J domain-containing protein n=1 Tax=Panagrellus redivivus TaxID=6233 RepID=A0A7E4W354_PANRE
MLKRRLCFTQPGYIRAFTSGRPPDHYAALGVPKTASSKEIKTAFYSLSKKYHPDTTTEDPQVSNEKFQKIVAAYEVLGTDDRRRAYDITVAPRYSSTTAGPTVRRQAGPGQRPRQYTDIDIDYKDFEHFQKTNRRKRVFHDTWQMPNEFYNKFAGEKKKADDGYTAYHDSAAAEREAAERKLREELEELKRRQKHPIPTFEQLIRDEEYRARERKKKSTSIGMGLVGVSIIVLFALANRH